MASSRPGTANRPGSSRRPGTSDSPTSPVDPEVLRLPQFPPGPPSIISSRMTDIASEDGDRNAEEQRLPNRLSYLATDSRPGTARTVRSGSRGGWSQSTPNRRVLQRGSLTQSISGSVSSARPPSSASRSHVPSLQSHAFFHPMSSQKLQAQRGASRPSNLQMSTTHDASPPSRDRVAVLRGAEPSPPPRMAQPSTATDEPAQEAPPSRGTEITDPETYDRHTANTSPTHGDYTANSLTESVRPLQREHPDTHNLRLDVDGTQNYHANAPTPSRTPSRTPRSFKSSFMLSRANSGANNSNRNMAGAEKLSSAATSPQTPTAPTSRMDTATTIKDTPKKLGKNYEHFEGNTVFCIGGRIQNTRHRPINVATGSFVVIPAVLFFVFSAPYLWYHVSPAVPIVFGYLFYICISSFLHASGSDPGILPRNMHQFPTAGDHEDPLRLAAPTNDWTLIKSAESSTAAMEVPTKYCKTCSLWRPPRAHHCRLCDNCVETQDHHCVWLNNCVGRRNYRYFFTFVSSATLLALYLCGASLAQILVYSSQEKVSFGESIDRWRVPFAMFVYGVIAFLYPAALMGYHLFLMARGETTREFLNSHKFLKKDRYRPFTQGSAFRNWIVVLCRPRPPTYLRFKGHFEEGDQRFGERRSQRQPKSFTGQEMEMQNVPPSSRSFQGPVALHSSGGV